MKFCGSCGAQVPDEAVICTSCGAPLQASQVPQQPYQAQDYQQSYQQQPYQQPYQQPIYHQPATSDATARGKAIASLVCGIVGLVFGTIGSCVVSCLCSVCGSAANVASLGVAGSSMAVGQFIVNLIALAICIVGIVLGVQARNLIPVGSQGRGVATAGFVCSIVATVLVGLAVLCSACSACTYSGCNACTNAAFDQAYNEAYRSALENYDW